MKYVCRILQITLITGIMLSVRAVAENVTEEEGFRDTMVVKDCDGLKFKVQEDRPIVREGGIVKPMDMDEYIDLKFRKLERRLDVVEEKLKLLEDEKTASGTNETEGAGK